jgi:hypothetical protein
MTSTTPLLAAEAYFCKRRRGDDRVLGAPGSVKRRPYRACPLTGTSWHGGKRSLVMTRKIDYEDH